MMKIDSLIRQSLMVCLSALLCSSFLPFDTYAQEVNPFSVKAKAAIAIDADSGKIFYEQNADVTLPIASMTKLVTLYLILEAIDDEKISWDEEIPISDHLVKISQDLELSNVLLYPDTLYSVRDLFNATGIVSANAAATALAEKISGSEKEFIDDMRSLVTSWGITDSYLISTSGINNEDAKGQIYPGSRDNEENTMSAKSVAIVARHLLNDYPEVLEMTKIPTLIFAEGTESEQEMVSSNWLLPGFRLAKDGVDGLKTGTTDLAGTCFTGTINREGHRIITVVMNVDNLVDDGSQRFIETSQLMDYVFDNWNFELFFKKGNKMTSLGALPIVNGKQKVVSTIASEDVSFWVKKDMVRDNHTVTFTKNKSDADKEQLIQAPIKKGEILGYATFAFSDDTLGYIDSTTQATTISVGAAETIKKANWFILAGRSVQSFFVSLF